MKYNKLLSVRFVHVMIASAVISLTAPAMADQVIVLAKPTANGYNTCPPWCLGDPTWSGSGSSSHSSAVGDNAAGSTFAYSGTPSISIQPTLAFTGVYQVDVTHISGNCSPNILVGMTATDGTLSASQTDGFDSTHGINTWYTVGYLTNTTTTPSITFTYLSGTLAATGGRWYTDGYRFTLLGLPCQSTPQIDTVNGPLAAGQTFVNVPKVSTNATLVTVYADDGVTQTAIGSVAVKNQTSAVVPTSALVKGRLISATQTVGGQESCLIPKGTGALVGGGANTQLGFCLDMQQDATLTGPIGANGTSTSTDLYFLGADYRTGGYATAPMDPTVIYPSTCWQTVYIDPATASYFHWAGDPLGYDPDPNHFAQLDAIAIAIADTDTGPYDIYLDNFMNGDTMVQNWEQATNGQAGVGFQAPGFASTTSGFLLAQAPGAISPNIDLVSTNHADTGSNSLRVSWQFINTLNVDWVRLVAVNHPQLDLTQPISFRVLILPVGVTNGDLKVSSLADQTQAVGGSATFTVSAAGTGPFSYQWYFNNTNTLGGATTNVYTRSNLATNDAGYYTVAVADANGCTNYSSASLTVSTNVIPVKLTISYDGAHVIINWPGSHTLQSSTAVGGGYLDVPGPVLTGPYQVTPSGQPMFFRLRN